MTAETIEFKIALAALKRALGYLDRARPDGISGDVSEGFISYASAILVSKMAVKTALEYLEGEKHV